MFSNFAIVNSYYETKGKTVDYLFGYGDRGRDLDVVEYEIFEVRFWEDEKMEKRKEGKEEIKEGKE